LPFEIKNASRDFKGQDSFCVCQPIIFNLFISIILNLVTVSFDFYLAFTAPDEGEFCLTEILGNKITFLSCLISLDIGFIYKVHRI